MFSVDPHQANLQPNLLLLGCRLRFNPTSTFLGVTFDRTLSFSKHVSSLKAKFFPRLKALRLKRALCLPTSFPISGLARLGLKPRLCRSSRRAFASTHPLTLPSTSLREALLACPPFPPWNLPSFIVESTLSSPSPALILFSLAKVRLSPTLTLFPHVIWCFGQTALFLLFLARAVPVYLPSALSVALRPLFPFHQALYIPVSLLKPASFCTLIAGLAAPTSLPFLFSFPPI